jgi:hypothetical protein
MQLTPAMRYGIVGAILIILFAFHQTYQAAADSLLTPAPASDVPVVIIVGLILGIGCGLLVFSNLRSRLVRRLGMIGLLAFVFYMAGSGGRGYYAAHAFPAAGTVHDTSRWMVGSASGNRISAMRRDVPQRIVRDFAFDAQGGQAASMGYCFERPIERSPSGAERLADNPPLTAGDLQPCS